MRGKSRMCIGTKHMHVRMYHSNGICYTNLICTYVANSDIRQIVAFERAYEPIIMHLR